MKTTHLLALVLTAGTAIQAQAYDSEYDLSQALSGFVVIDSTAGAMSPSGAFRGEFAINQDLAGFEAPAAAHNGDGMRHAFRNENDLNQGLPGYAPTRDAAQVSALGETVRAGFRGEYQLNRDLSGFEMAKTERVSDGARHLFRNEYELTHGTAAVAVGAANSADGGRIGLQSEFDLDQQLTGFTG